MSLGTILKAAFKTGNFALLAAVFIVSILTNFSIPFMLVGLAGYIYFVIQTLRSREFMMDRSQTEKLDGILATSEKCDDLYRQVCRTIDKNLRIKVSGINKLKNELMEYFDKYCDDPVKQRIIEQALNLVTAYYNLVCTYSERRRELSAENLNELASRINFNNRRLGSLKSYDAVLELTKTVEMDERLLQDLKQEREDLEKTSVKLDYIESTIDGFKHRILSTDSSDPESEEIEDVINEATALENVLGEWNKKRQRL